MIKSFRYNRVKALFDAGIAASPWRAFAKVARRKLLMLDAAMTLQDLKSPPGNRLEALGGDRHGQHSIRINDQFRVCFVWTAEGVENVEIVDYH